MLRPSSSYQSFVYETIPRNGQGNIVVPGDPSSVTDADDSVTIEADIFITMAWTQFLYSDDTWVKIARATNNTSANSASNVVVRPTHLDIPVTDDGEGNIYLRVPYSHKGLRLSVEFLDNVYEYHDECDTTRCDFVQDWHPAGPNYVPAYTAQMPVMSAEPHDALLVFASPFPDAASVPARADPRTFVVPAGRVPDLRALANHSAVYFPAGVYYMTGTSHAVLAPAVDWVYLAPGAYVKGAVQFTSAARELKATGFGVLSGEQYVYQANTAAGYTNNASNADSLRMWSGHSAADVPQTFVLTGLTTNAPPFNSIDFTGDLATMAIAQSDYKQVGAFFGQTDGTTLYAGSHVRDTFYHSNDDTIKTYGSHVLVHDVVVWKGKTAPVIQFGWDSRNLTNITVSGVDVIHMKYNANESHPSIIGANQVYGVSENDTNTANLSNTIQDVYFGNIRAEGIGGNLMRIVPLANYHNITIENVSLAHSSVRSNAIYQSELPEWQDEDGNLVGMSGFTIRNFTIDGTKICSSHGNTGPDALGGLNIASKFMQSGAVTIE